MFAWFKKKQAASPDSAPAHPEDQNSNHDSTLPTKGLEVATPQTQSDTPPNRDRQSWLGALRSGLARTGSHFASLFTGTRIDEALYEELESALLMSDAGTGATSHILKAVQARVKSEKATERHQVKAILQAELASLLQPMQQTLSIHSQPHVLMVVGVNGAGKTTSIGKLTRHLSNHGASVLLAAADTFRAAAKQQLAVWAERADVEIISQEGADPASVAFDAVSAGKARRKDVVIVDTAGRLPTQLHLMEELKKIKRVIGKADASAPHDIILVLDGNTGQNALHQVQAFEQVLGLTGLIVTKLDGTAKGGVLAAIALWNQSRQQQGQAPLPVYFIGVGEKLEELETFDAQEFAQALLS